MADGNNLKQEPLQVRFDHCLEGQSLQAFSTFVVKGFTRITVPLYVLLRAIAFQPDAPEVKPVLRRAV
eukprot:11037381-Alexandrium_andersonii.AAC.1